MVENLSFRFYARSDFFLQVVLLKSGCGMRLALSQRLSPLGLIFRSPTPTSGNKILVYFRISLLKHIKLINYYSRHYALSKTALIISFDHKLLEL